MRHLLALGVLLLTLAGSRSAKVEYSLINLCKILKHHFIAEDSDAKTLLAEAIRQLRERNVHIKFGPLISVWEKAVNEEKCDGSSLKAVATLRVCESAMEYTFPALTDAIKKYANRCLTPIYLAKKIPSYVEGWFKKGPESFMDESFMAKYRADNPDEPPIHFGYRSDGNCCQPKNARSAIIKTIESHKGKGPFKDRKSLKNYLKSNLFKPCQNYYERARDVMFQIDGASYYIDGGLQALIDEMPESEDVIFRFNMCHHLRYGRVRVEALEEVFRELRL